MSDSVLASRLMATLLRLYIALIDLPLRVGRNQMPTGKRKGGLRIVTADA